MHDDMRRRIAYDFFGKYVLHQFACHCDEPHGILVHPKLILAVGTMVSRLPESKTYTCTSGHRCVKHNKSVRGAVAGSRHTFGMAADGVVDGWTPQEFYTWLEEQQIPEFESGAVGLYVGSRNFLHLDVRPKRVRFAFRDWDVVPVEEALKG